MKLYIYHQLLVFNEQIQQNPDDPVFMRSMELAFQWANDMGLMGKKVFDLHFQEPDPKEYNPMKQQQIIWCKIECTEEERMHWEELQKLNIKNAVNHMLKDDE
jgi:hypothetical protein